MIRREIVLPATREEVWSALTCTSRHGDAGFTRKPGISAALPPSPTSAGT